MNDLFAGILAIAISLTAGGVLARIIVELIDLAGYCWNGPRETKRHAADAHETPPPLRRITGPYRLVLGDPRVSEAIRKAETHRTPLADAVRRARTRRLVQATGGPR